MNNTKREPPGFQPQKEEEYMSKRLLILMCSIFLIVPLIFMGCGGNDGATGATGATGGTGDTGATGPAGPGSVSNEACVVCHGAGKDFDVRTVHSLNADGTKASLGSVTATINDVEFPVSPTGDNVAGIKVTFTMVAKSVDGTTITGNINLTTASSNNLTYLNFAIAKLETGQTYATGNKDPNVWHGYVLKPGASGSGPFYTQSLLNGGAIALVSTLAAGQYTYTFPDNAVRVCGAGGGYDSSLTHRVGMQIYSLPAAPFRNLGFSTTLPAPFANATFDKVPAGGTVLTRDIVTTAACNACHDPLGQHSGGARYDTKYCVVCHNPNIATGAPGWDNASFVKLIHGIHSEKNLGRTQLDFSEVTFPQDIRNCDTCHKGTDGDNWKNLPSIEACGSCHTDKTWSVANVTATVSLHSGGAWDNNAFCANCHVPSGTDLSVTAAHADPNTTLNNVTAGADNIVYFIDNVTMSGNNPVVTFHITRNGSNLALASPVVPPNDSTGVAYTGTPAFLLGFATTQDTVTTPADYNNQGNALVSAIGKNGQPESVTLTGLTLTGTSAAYTTTLTKAFPALATMRAVALQSYWSQTIGGVSVGRHTPSVVKAVTGDAVRRTVVKSGYNATTGAPEGCLECHKKLELHGGSRVNNVQVCVICHNPNMTSSARTIDPAIVGGIDPEITALFGTDPLTYPEVSNTFKDLIHGIHSSEHRSEPGSIEFVDIRNFGDGVLILGNEVTFPGDLKHCTKCHIVNGAGTNSNPYVGTYVAELPDNVLLNTTKITTGNASETRAEIIAVRNTVPNATDLVNSPIASACYGCHAGITMASHAVQMGGDINSTRTGALLEIPWDLTLTP